MNDYEKKALAFHKAFDGIFDQPLSVPLLELRKALLSEEMRELFAEVDRAIADIQETGAVTPGTCAAMLKEMADVQYVLSGTSAVFGLPMQQVFDRVHDSNMSKLGADGKPILRADGKILKGPNYRPPDLSDLAESISTE